MFTFETEAQKKVYEKVAGILKEQFGKQAAPDDDHPRFVMQSGSAVVQIVVYPVDEKFTVVRAFSWVVTGAEPSTDLYKFLLKENDGFRFGGFAIDDDGDIEFGHSIVGEGCDADELLWTVGAVASTADKYDDIIVQRFGGQRAEDR